MNPSNYDADLHMLREAPKPVNLNHLAFLRYLGEAGRLEHPVAGPVCGSIVNQAVEELAQRSPDYSDKAA